MSTILRFFIFNHSIFALLIVFLSFNPSLVPCVCTRRSRVLGSDGWDRKSLGFESKGSPLPTEATPLRPSPTSLRTLSLSLVAWRAAGLGCGRGGRKRASQKGGSNPPLLPPAAMQRYRTFFFFPSHWRPLPPALPLHQPFAHPFNTLLLSSSHLSTGISRGVHISSCASALPSLAASSSSHPPSLQPYAPSATTRVAILQSQHPHQHTLAPMTHAFTVSTSRWPSPSSPAPLFQDLPAALHRMIASYLHTCEALAVGATKHAMQGIYPATITHVSIHP